MTEQERKEEHRYAYPQGGTDWARIEAMTDEEAH